MSRQSEHDRLRSAFLLLVYTLTIFSVSQADILNPSQPGSRSVLVCLGSMPEFVCNTTEGGLLWETSSTSTSSNYLYDANFNRESPRILGNFTVYRDGVTVSMMLATAVNSTAILTDPVQLSHDGITLKCFEDSDLTKFSEVILRVGLPPAPIVTPITQINSSSLLISWSMSDCAVQYVVTIINSSDDSVYLNITTSDTNTTVTLPTGVEYCVTVLGVDAINRTGPPSQQLCHRYVPSVSSSITIISSSIGSTVSTSSPSPSIPSVDPPPSGVSEGAIAGIVIVLVVLVIIVSAIVAVLVIVLYQRRRGYGKLQRSNKQEIPLAPVKCVCQMYYQEIGLNHWKIKFLFVLSEDILESVKMSFYKDYKQYGSPIDCYWKSSDTIQVKVTNRPDGWIVNTSDDKVHKATIEGYTGEVHPPQIEMMITPASDKTTPPDLTVEAKLKGVRTEPNIIKFEKEAQNVVEYVYQVFYHKLEGINHWIARFVFTPKQHKKKVEDLYQDANNCSWYGIRFGAGVIELSTVDQKNPAGWEVNINKQVTTAAVEQYTGEGEPPYCEMTLRATDIAKMDDLLLLPVTLIGVRMDNNKIDIKRALVDRDGIPRCASLPFLSSVPLMNYVCQVFYHKRGLNYWKATIAFFSKHPTVSQRVQHLYQDANSDPPVDITSFSSIKPRITKVDGWTVNLNVKHKEVKYEKVIEYLRNGVGSPPHCELSIKAASDDVTPPDLVLDITLNGVSGTCSRLKIIRKAEKPVNVFNLGHLDHLPRRDVHSMPIESDDEYITDLVTSFWLKSGDGHSPKIVGDTPKAVGDPPNAGGDAESTKVKAEDTVREKKQQSQFPMRGESSETTHRYMYHVDFDNA